MFYSKRNVWLSRCINSFRQEYEMTLSNAHSKSTERRILVKKQIPYFVQSTEYHIRKKSFFLNGAELGHSSDRSHFLQTRVDLGKKCTANSYLFHLHLVGRKKCRSSSSVK